jgi:type IV pilus assembly protein PilM
VVDWKKEIKLSDLVGGKKKDDAAAPEAVDAVEQPQQTSIWKKEISFGRKKPPKQVDAVPDKPAAVELLDAYIPEPSRGPSAAELLGPLVSEAGPSSAAAPAAPGPGPVLPEAPEVVEPAPPLEQPETTEVIDLHAPLPPAAAPMPAPIDLAAPAPSVPQPLPVELPELPAPTPAPPPEPVVVHPPVPAAQLPPLPDEQPPAKQKKKEKAEKPAAEVKARTKRERGPRASRSGKLPKRIVGLKIGASQLAAATVENNGSAEVVQLARQPLKPGVVSNGELRDPEQLAEALKEFFKRNKLPKRGVRLGIATNRIGVRTLEIPGIDDPKQLANAIRFRAQEALPIPIDEAVLDFQVLSESTNDAGESTRRILLVLAYRDLIDRYVTACRKAGLQLVGIDLEAFALLRALAAPRAQDAAAQAALVAVTVGHDRTTFAVSDGRVCEFTRVLDWGGEMLNVALARTLDVTPAEAEDVKRQLSLDGHEIPEGLREEQAHKAREALRRQVQAFARELVSSLQFYQNQPGSLGIGEVVVTGGTAHLAGFTDELQRLIGVRVRIGDPLVRVRAGKKLKEPEQLGSLAVAIGLGIED